MSMRSKPPILNQAVADSSGFTLYSRPARDWSHLAEICAVCFACCSLFAHKFYVLEFVFLPITLITIAAAVWLRKTRFEFTLQLPTRTITIVDGTGLKPIKRISFRVEDIARVEFGSCKNGRQPIRCLWNDPHADPIEAILYCAADSEGDLARSVRKTLATAAIPVVNLNSED